MRNSFSLSGARSTPCAGGNCGLHVRIRTRVCGASEPVVEPDFTEFCFVAGEKRPFAQLGPEVTRMRIRNNFTRIVLRAQDTLDKSVEIERLGPTHFNGAIQRSARRNLRDHTRNIVGSDRLDEHRWHANGAAVAGGVRDGFQELEELRGLDNRVRDRRLLDQLLLRKLRAEIAALQQTSSAHDRQRHVMFDAGSRFGGEQVVR